MIHVVVITDDHSWVAGQGRHSNKFNANYGDILSFYEHLQRFNNYQQGQKNDDTFLVMNGDFMDGTGLSEYPPTHLMSILQAMPWDATTIGNHDIYKNETVEYLTKPDGFFDTSNYMVTSNAVHRTTRQPLGRRFLHLYGANSNSTILVFGFLVDIDTTKVGSPLVTVEPVKDVVKQDWFLDVLKSRKTKKYDAILILAHMGTDDLSIGILMQAIRNVVGPDMPVQFVTGHTHLLRYQVLDSCATAIEAGKYLETIGVVSFPTTKGTSANICSTAFSHEFVPANVEALSKRVQQQGDNFLTPNGQAMTDLIHKTQDEMGLSRVIGCSPRTFKLNQTLDAPNSLYGLWKRVLEKQLLNNAPNMAVLQGTRSSFRHDLFKGPITMDDILIVSPFNDTMYKVAQDLDERTLTRLTKHMNSLNLHSDDGFLLSDFVLLKGNTTRSHIERIDLYTLEYEVPFILQGLGDVLGNTPLAADNTNLPTPTTVAATSLWLGFLENYWPTCKVHRNNLKVHHSPSSQVLQTPDNIMIGIAITCAVIALVLSFAFVCRPTCWKMARRSIEPI